MLRWIGQQFKQKSTSNSLTNSQLDQGEEKSSNLDLTDGDYEFLFNQLLEGVAHGWHQVRIVKFFDQLGERGETEKWVAWLKRFYQKLPTSPNPIQRQLGAKMIRLGELIQSHKKLQEIGVISDEIGRKLFFGDIEEIIWEYDGTDIVSLPSPPTNPATDVSPPATEAESTTEENILLDQAEKWASIEEEDSEPTVIQNSFIPTEPEELALDTEEAEFPFVPEDGSEPTVIQNKLVSNQSTGLPLNTEEFPLEPEDDSESPWEQPELISAIPQLIVEEDKQQSQGSELASDSFMKNEIPEIFPEPSDYEHPQIESIIDKPPTFKRSPKNLEASELLESWFELGLKQANVGDLEKAIASWDKVLEFNPELAEVWHNRGSALGRMGKYAESVISFDRALEIEPNHYQAWNDRAHALYLMEKWQEAVDSWNKTISIMPNNHQFWYNRGCALEKLNLIEEAIASHEKALEIQPDFEPAKSKYLSLLTDT